MEKFKKKISSKSIFGKWRNFEFSVQVTQAQDENIDCWMTREAKFAHNFVQAVVFKSDKCKMSDQITKYAE